MPLAVNFPDRSRTPPRLRRQLLARAGHVAAKPGRRILMAEDNRDGADSLAMMLRLLGNEIQTVNDRPKAVEGGKAFRPEIILMDIGMPCFNGIDETQRIRQQPWGKAITIIPLMRWGQESDREWSREAG
jgi:CheY-like chemotaxis protein